MKVRHIINKLMTREEQAHITAADGVILWSGNRDKWYDAGELFSDDTVTALYSGDGFMGISVQAPAAAERDPETEALKDAVAYMMDDINDLETMKKVYTFVKAWKGVKDETE